MSKFITMPQVNIIVDALYRNYSKPKFEQKNVNQLAANCGISAAVLLKVRSILAERQLLIIEGERAQQQCYWNTVKSAPNPAMLTDIYRVYTKDVKSRVKVERKRAQRLPSEELALQAFVKRGATKVTVEYAKGRKTIIEVYDLSTMEVGE